MFEPYHRPLSGVEKNFLQENIESIVTKQTTVALHIITYIRVA